ncbi:MAG: hypothetical protein RSA92_04510, partial [Bacteroidaceae bacterium]
ETKKETKKRERKPSVPRQKTTVTVTVVDELVGKPCPLCGKGTIIKGKTAYGCSLWKEGCTFRQSI